MPTQFEKIQQLECEVLMLGQLVKTMLFLMLNEGVDEIHGEQNNYTICFKVHACEG